MRALFAPVLAVLVLIFASGCALAASGPQTGLPVETITIDTKAGPHPFKVEIAADDQSRETGLMFRKTMARDAGMMFDFHTPQEVSFWMENTILPLDMLFVRADGTIARVKENAVPYSRETIPSGEPVQFVIELNAGRAQALGIKEGGHIRAPEMQQNRR